jgi:hypothetical protein
MAKKTSKKPTAKKDEVIKIPAIEVTKANIKVRAMEGSTLLMDRLTEETIEELLAGQMGEAPKPQTHRDPKAEFEAARYCNEKGQDCIPALAFKRAMSGAAKFIKGVDYGQINGAVFVPGDLIPIKYKKLGMRRDVGRIGPKRIPYAIFRPEYTQWEATIPIMYDPSVISPSELANLLSRAGFSLGVGAWRPQKKGDHGRFEVG